MSKYSVQIQKVRDFIEQFDNTYSSTAQSRILMDMYEYLLTDEAALMINDPQNTRFRLTIMKKLLEFGDSPLVPANQIYNKYFPKIEAKYFKFQCDQEIPGMPDATFLF